MNKGVHIPLKIGDRIPGSTSDEPEWMQTLKCDGWGYQLESDADTKLREKQAHESNKEEQVDNAREQRKVLDNAANKAAEKAAAKKRKKGRGMEGLKAEKLATKKIEMAEAMKVAERAAKADKLSALAAIAVNNLVENPSDMQSTGIPNMACTCYFNVILQMLFSTPMMFSGILQMHNSDYDDIITALQNVFLEMSDTSKGAMVEKETLTTFFNSFGGFNETQKFDIGSQETPMETFMKVIDRCVKAAENRGLKDKAASWFRTMSFVTETFVQKNSLTGEVRKGVETGTVGMHFNATMGESMEVDMARMTNPDILREINFKWAPKETSDADLKKNFTDAPHYARDDYSSGSPYLVVEPNRTAVLSDLKTTGKWSFENHLELFGNVYDLMAVVVHQGKMVGVGHYFMFKRVGRKWWIYDDTTAQASSWQEVMKYAYGEFADYTANMLVYAKTVPAP
jgi:hypothetical protein